MPSSRESSWPGDWTHISYVSCISRGSLPLQPPGPKQIMSKNVKSNNSMLLFACYYKHAIINMSNKHIIQPQFYDKKATACNFSVCKKFTLRVQVFKFKLNLSNCIRSKNNGWGLKRNSSLWGFIYHHFLKPSLCASWGYGLPLPQGLRT